MTNVDKTRRYDDGTLPADIFRHWIHSREEDVEGVEVYRPEGFDFPPAFARDGFEMFVDGRFVQEDIGPADGTVQVPGRWMQVADRRVSVTFDQSNPARDGFDFEIVDVEDTVLRIRRVDSDDPDEDIDEV